MEQRIALITGGVRGIGRAVAIALAERGWAVAASYRSSAEQAKTLGAECPPLGKRSSYPERRRCRSRRGGRARAAYGVAELGRIDALINCGLLSPAPLLEESPRGGARCSTTTFTPCSTSVALPPPA